MNWRYPALGLLCGLPAISLPVLSFVDLRAAPAQAVQHVDPDMMPWVGILPRDPDVSPGARALPINLRLRPAEPIGPIGAGLQEPATRGHQFPTTVLLPFDFDEIATRARGPSRLLAAPRLELVRPGRPSDGLAERAISAQRATFAQGSNTKGAAAGATSGGGGQRVGTARLFLTDDNPLSGSGMPSGGQDLSDVALPDAGLQFGTGLSLLVLMGVIGRRVRRPVLRSQ